MTSSTEAIFNAALALSENDRAALAFQLFESLDKSNQGEIDAAWVEEAERRLQAFEQGTMKAIPGDEVMRPLLGNKE